MRNFRSTSPATDSDAASGLSESDNGARVDPLVLVRLLSRRYLLVLSAVATLVVVDQAIIQPQLVRLNFYAPAINIAGRQRMLSQKVTKESLALATRPRASEDEARRQALRTAIAQWSAAHHSLLDGDAVLGLEPIQDPRIAAALRSLEPQLIAIRDAATRIAAGNTQSSQPSADTMQSLNTILSSEPRFLQGMEQVVTMLESSSGKQISFLRWCGMAVMALVLGLLVGVYFLVLRPAVEFIRNQISKLAASELQHREMADLLGQARDELERRVAERTEELLQSNLALTHEIAERQAAEGRTRELSTELARASRVTALGQLATGLAHEINQPLASITNYADVLELGLEDGSLDSTTMRDTLAHLKQASVRAGKIVRRMRNFVRPAPEQPVLVELNALVLEVCELCRPQFEQSHVRLSTHLCSESTQVKADSLDIQQVLVNLMQNAAQAMAASPRERREIQVHTRSNADHVTVDVLDLGPGFPTPLAEESFTPFFTTKPDGLGMGLAISRGILDRYRGRLWGENRTTGGASVSFSLPFAKQHEPEDSNPTHCLCR